MAAITSYHFPTVFLNPNEAPEGYVAVLKSSLRQNDGNLCRQCDFRPNCDQVKHRCSSNGLIVAATGKIVERKDGCSVAFKFKA